jgi:hypothetical protein
MYVVVEHDIERINAFVFVIAPHVCQRKLVRVESFLLELASTSLFFSPLKMVFVPPPLAPPLAPPSFPDGHHRHHNQKSKKNKKNKKTGRGEENNDDDDDATTTTTTTTENASKKKDENGIETQREKRNEPNDALKNEKETTMIALDEETVRWRNERKKNYPRSAKTNDDDVKKTEQEAAAAKRKREEELERVLEEQRRLGSFEATVLLKEEQKVQEKNDNSEDDKNNKNKNKKRSEQPCKFWTRNGKCRYGDKCLFLHDEAKRGVGKSGKNDTNTNAKRHKSGGAGGGGGGGGGTEIPLLRRIFKNDIDRDNSRLLQSIRFFVENIDELRKYAVARERSEEMNREYLKRLKMFSFVDDPVKRTKNSIAKKKFIEEAKEKVFSSEEEEEEEEEVKENKQDVGGFFSCYDSEE